MSTDHPKVTLDPKSQDPEALDPPIYHAVVGPPLQAAADVAAARGDPTLHADMPAMLALIDLITRFGGYWRAENHYDDKIDELLTGAAASACVMVLQEAKMPPDNIGQCLGALESAYDSLLDDDVTDIAKNSADHAWQALKTDNRELAAAQLKQATQQIVAAIEVWQAQVH